MHEEINQMHGLWMDVMEGLDVDGWKNDFFWYKNYKFVLVKFR